MQCCVQQHHGLPVPHEEVWEGGVRAGEDAAQLFPLWEELQVQGGFGVSPEIRARSRKSGCVLARYGAGNIPFEIK